MRRWFGLWLVAALLAAAGGYGGYWFYVAGELRAGLAPWAAARRAEGIAVAWQAASVEGFPWAFRIRFTAASLAAGRPLPVELKCPALSLSARPWSFARWAVELPQGASLAGPVGIGAVHAAAAHGSAARAGADETLALTASDIGGEAVGQGFSAATLTLDLTLPGEQPQSHRDPAFTFAARLSDLLIATAPAPLGHEIDAAALTATVRGRIPRGVPLDAALAAWRDDGGTVDIDGAELAWDGARIAVTGTLALDRAMQPSGAFTATVTGADRMVDAAVAAGQLEARYAQFAKSVLRAISGSGAETDGALQIPVTVQDERVYLGPAPVATLPPIRWRALP